MTRSPELPAATERLFLLTLAGIQFSHVLDFMIMMPLGPILMQALGIDTHHFGLLVASYSFSAAASGLLATTFVDRFERKQLLLILFALFTLATLACGLAPGYLSLMVARGLAGAFGGILGALIHTMIADAIPYQRRARASGTVSAAFSVSTVAGVPLSLLMANALGWRAPFLFIALLCLVFIVVGAKALPRLEHHLEDTPQRHLLAALFDVLAQPNHLAALLFSSLIIFSGFTVIPYITVYAVGNVGIAQSEIPLVYLVGGAATLITARFIGRWADRRGKVKVYRILAALAMIPIALVTHVSHLPLALWIACTTGFFVLVSGRMIPAMAVISSAAEPRLRGTFLSLNSTVQSLAMGLATTLAGFVVSQQGSQLEGYPTVGYIALAANCLAMVLAGRIYQHVQGGGVGASAK